MKWIFFGFFCFIISISGNLLPNPITGYDKKFVQKMKHINIPDKINLKITDQDLNTSVLFGESVIDRMHRLETNLDWSNIYVKDGTPAYGQLIESNPKTYALSHGKYALVAAKATSHVMSSYCFKKKLSFRECSSYLSKYKFQTTYLKTACSKFTFKCEKNEKYRLIDGSCNHLNNGSIGQSSTGYKRLLFADYLDGVYELRRSKTKQQLPSARLISTNLIMNTNEQYERFSLGVMQWGQFIAHDLSHTAVNKMIHSGNAIECCTASGSKLPPRYLHPLCVPIIIPPDDKFYSKLNQQCMSYVRSIPALRSDCSLGPVDQLNQATHFLDGSQIYGSDIMTNYKLRSYSGGKLEMKLINKKEYLPTFKNSSEFCQTKDEDSACFKSGDPRVNAQPQLTVMHTIWVREHNRIAEELSRINPKWTEETLFEEARRIVIAEMQHITYNEWLPNILDKTYLKTIFSFATFNDEVDSSVSNSFATAAIRFVKSLMPENLELYTESNNFNGNLKLSEHFYKPDIITKPGILEDLIRGLGRQKSEKADLDYNHDITNLMYGNGTTGYDIFSLDIQRGRDHGLPGYASYRTLCGLPEIKEFNDLKDVIPEKVVNIISQIYKHVEDIDLIVGGMSERSRDQSLLGPTFSCILADQFFRTRVGDRFFYSHLNKPLAFTKSQLNEIKKVTLGRVLCDNSNVRMMQKEVFLVESERNPILDCSKLPQASLIPWKNFL